jgi:predicted component of type VI protein secretion system
MRTAATAADVSTLRLLAAQLAATQPELAAALRRWIDAFDYDAIQHALEEF